MRSHQGALVTGAGKRIGRAIALALGKQGWAVAVHHGGSGDEASEVVDEIVSAGGQASAVQADLGEESQVAQLVGDAVEGIGPLTLLVNNASTFDDDSIETATRASWDRHIEVNLRAPFVLSQRFAAQLPADSQGNIVNLIDQRVWNLTPSFMTYTVSKTGLWTLTQTMAMALAPRIRVNAIGPGPTLPSVHQTAAQFDAQCARMPLGHGTSPSEIAAAIGFILAAPAMTGQMIALDGGQHLGWSHGRPTADA